MQPVKLHGDNRHRIMFWPAPSGQVGQRLLVTFEHGSTRMKGFRDPNYPHLANRFDLDVMAVQTARRDWYISHRSAALALALEQLTARYADVTATGFSMGGYAALLYSKAAHVQRLLAVSPQFSIDPKVAPFDPGRRRKFRMIGRPMPQPQDRGNSGVGGMILYDPSISEDRIHAGLICQHFPRLTAVALAHGGHPASGVLGDSGKLGVVAGMVIRDRIDPRKVLGLHRAGRRSSPRYRLNLCMAALKKHSDRALPVLHAYLADPEQSPDDRLNLGLQLLERGDAHALELLTRLLEETADAPPAWLDRIMRTIARSEKLGLL